MELLDRYLNAVRFWLPRAQKRDIIDELSEDIHAEVEEKETGLGRKINDDELAAILKRRGSPFAVAQRYLPQRQLIGPAVFPVYLLVLKLVGLFYLVPWLAVWVGLVIFVPSYRAQHPGWELAKTMGTLWQVALYTFAMVTIGFAVVDSVRQKAAHPDKWDPRRLPRVRNIRLIPRSSSLAGVVFGIVFLLFWLGALRFPEIVIPGTPPARLTLGPVWLSFRQGYYAQIAALALVGVALNGANLIRPYWTRGRLAVRAAADAASVIILAAVLVAHWAAVQAQWLELSAAKFGVSGIEGAQKWINISVFASLLIAALICAAECAVCVRRILLYEKGKRTDLA